MAKKRKRKKTPRAAPVAKKRRGTGFGALFSSGMRRYFMPVASASAVLLLASAFREASDGSAVSYVVFYIAVAVLLAAVASTAARSARRALVSPADVLEPVKEEDRGDVCPGTIAGAICTAAAAASVISAVVVFWCLLLLTSAVLAVAGSAAFLSASYYVSLVLAVTAAQKSAIGSRRRFIRGVVGIYTIGLLALILILACTSRVPLGDDFTGINIPSGTLASLSLLYLFATLLRSVYLYFILRRRLRTE